MSLAQSLIQFLSLQCLQDTLAKGKCMLKHSASAMSAHNRWKKGPYATQVHHVRRSQHWHLSQHYKEWLCLICNGGFSETTSFFPSNVSTQQFPVSRAEFKPASAGILQDIPRTIQIPRSHMHILQTVSLLWDVGFCLGLFAREALGWQRESNTLSCG